MKKKKTRKEEIIGWIKATPVIIIFLIGVFGIVNNAHSVIKDYFYSKSNDGFFELTIDGPMKKPEIPLHKTELERLFPQYKEDWIFAKKFAGVNGLKMPLIYWQMEDTYNDLISEGSYNDSENIIDLDREIFATTTKNYDRYVLLHEFMHAALDRSDQFKHDIDDHCYMVDEEYFIAVGKRIGNYELGQVEHQNYKEACDGTIFRWGY